MLQTLPFIARQRGLTVREADTVIGLGTYNAAYRMEWFKAPKALIGQNGNTPNERMAKCVALGSADQHTELDQLRVLMHRLGLEGRCPKDSRGRAPSISTLQALSEISVYQLFLPLGYSSGWVAFLL